MYELRSYQEEAVTAGLEIIEAKKSKNRGILVLPTASGKSLVIAEIVNRSQKKTIILQPTKEILEQNLEKIKAFGMSDIGIFSASMGEKTIGKITIATIGSIIKHKKRFSDFELIIIDEADLVNSKGGQYEDFINTLSLPVIGLTATPYRMRYYRNLFGNGEPVVESRFLTRTRPRIFSTIKHITQIPEMFENGYLCPIKYDAENSYDSLKVKSNSTGQGYAESALLAYNAQQDIIPNVVKTVIESPAKHKLIFMHFREESKKVIEKLSQIDIRCEEISGATKKHERERILKDFRAGKTHVCNVGTLVCLSADTEILTKTGWVGHKDISYNHNVAQYDKINESIDFAFPEKIIKKTMSVGSKMANLDGRYVSIRVTGDHNMLATTSSKGQFIVKKADHIAGKQIFIPVSGYAKPEIIKVKQKRNRVGKKRFVSYTAHSYRKKGMQKENSYEMAITQWNIKQSHKFSNPNELSLNECRFIGFWIGDGSRGNYNNSGERFALVQSLKTPKMLSWIENILSSCSIEYSFKDFPPKQAIICGKECNVAGHRHYDLCKGTGGHNQNRQGLYRLMPYLKKKGTPLLWGLDKNQFHAIMEGLWKADGWHGNNKTYTGGKIVGEHKELFDLLQAIGVCRGFKITVKPVKMRKNNKKQLYNISLFNKRRHRLTRQLLKNDILAKKENVWCVSMPKETIITRRVGTVTIMGNCGYDFPELDHIILARPTKSLRLYSQICGRGLRIAQGKEYCIISDLCDNVKRFGEINSFWIEDISDGIGLWRLRSNKGYLTGVNMITGKDLEERQMITRGEKKQALSGEMLIPFGKHNGEKLSDLDQEYMAWCIENFDKKNKWIGFFKGEIKRRKEIV